MNLTEALWSLITSGLAGAGLVWLLRGWISERLKQSIRAEYEQRLAEHKAQLNRENDVYLAEVRAKHEESKQLLDHNLELARLEHQVKYAGSYQEILGAIKDVHAKLIEIQRASNSYTNIFESSEGPSKEQRRKEAAKLVSEFWEVFNPRRIFFSEKLDKQVVSYIHTVTDKGIEFMLKVEQNQAEHTIADWTRIDEEVRSQWDTVLRSIRQQFRAILGVEEASEIEQVGAANSGSAGAPPE